MAIEEVRMTIIATSADADYLKSPIATLKLKPLTFILLSAMGLVYLLSIALMLPVLLVYSIGCSFWCLAIAISSKLFSQPTSPKTDIEY